MVRKRFCLSNYGLLKVSPLDGKASAGLIDHLVNEANKLKRQLSPSVAVPEYEH